MKTKLHIFTVCGLLAVFSGSCSDFLDPQVTRYATKEQITELGESSPEAIVTIADGIIQGIYNYMNTYRNSAHDTFGQMAIGLAGDLMTEDMVQLKNHWFFSDYNYANNVRTYRRVADTWAHGFTLVSKANEVIAMIPPATTHATLKAYLGQALALRAFGLHLVVQRYQQTYKGNEQAKGVPIYLTANDDATTFQGRAPVADVYARIVEDLTKAIELLDGYTRPTKVMINKQVAAAFLARVCLVTEDWPNAQTYANMARQGWPLMTAAEAGSDGYNDINNKECMWGANITGETTTMFASFFSHIGTNDAGYAGALGVYKAMDTRLREQMGANDCRVNLYYDKEDSYINNKFKPVTAWLADYIFMRVSEMYFIEAEALVRQNKAVEGATVLGLLMANRDPDWIKTTVTVEDIFLQKRLEMWGEGVIFYDYLRLKKGVNRIYSGTNHISLKDVPAGSWLFLYQIPQTEIDNNSEMTEADQNPAL